MKDYPPIPWKTFNRFCQIGHVGCGMLSIFGPIVIWGYHGLWWYFGISIGAIAVKEKWIDPWLESPPVAGSGWQDWFWWTLGVIIAVVFFKITRGG